VATPDVDFYFDPTCPYAWVTSRWLVEVPRQRPLRVGWRPLALRLLDEPIGYHTRPPDYPHAHQRGLEMLRIVHAREQYGPEVVGGLYTAMGEEIWGGPPPAEATCEAVLAEEVRPRDLAAVLARAGLAPELAAAAHDSSRDAAILAETCAAVDRAGGDVGTPCSGSTHRTGRRSSAR
jgi:2-hydroxychromene-2-carboxylate isomerase